VKDADEILVLEGGGIVERGSHTALLQLNGRYAQMYRRQLLEEELEVDVERDEHEKRIRAEQEDLTRTSAPRIRAERLGLEE
jgi:ABC-type glutathione transport system ATPase component